MKKILIINPFGVGDVLFTTPVITALKKKFPDSFIGYLCQKQTAPILENHPLVDKLFLYTRGDLKQVRKKSYLEYVKMLLLGINKIKYEKFDLAVDLSMVSQYSLLLWLLGVKQRFGFDYKGRGLFLTHKLKVNGLGQKHVIEYYRDLLSLLKVKEFNEELKFYTALADRQFADNLLINRDVDNKDILIGIAPFGGGSWGEDAASKQWPDECFVRLINDLLNAYECKIIIFGTKKNMDDCAIFKEVFSNKGVVNAIGRTTLGQLGALIGKCSLFISNDSGPMHIACAKEVNTISIFGPVDERVYGPVGKTACHEIVKADIECRPCYKNFKKPDCKNMDCLEAISEEMVLDAAEKVLKVKKIKRSKEK
ncbi:MAG: glycosyltransferase family 9 protein [Candidatus Omnitrophica bacterium]|nr:glycosyltransferase family 9 protein [Candidatus Omnitrophota bacterium]